MEANISADEPKRHIVLSGKRIIVGVENKTYMSEDYDKFHEIPPFKVNIDPSLFFKQKTAYGILRSDWSSDVCSSDLTN